MLLPRTRVVGFCVAIVGLGAFGVSVGACGSSQNRSGFDTDGSTSPAGDGGIFAPTTDGPAVDQNGCSEAAKLVYVLSYEGDLYSFAPADKKFTKIGPLGCKLGAQQSPISMAVDRKGIAWVNVSSAGTGARMNTLYKVDTATAGCTQTNITSDYIGGMGFSTDNGTKDQETLFVFGQSGSAASPEKTLNHVDFDNEKIVTGPTVTSGAGELTGTGDGRLFGFVLHDPQTDPVSGKPMLNDLLAITALDKTTGKDSGESVLKGVKFPHDPGFAFSFWGGDFYVYSAPITIPADYPFTQPPSDLKDEPTTDVARYSPTTKTTEPSYMQAIGFHIVGAGVSTCAPTSGVR